MKNKTLVLIITIVALIADFLFLIGLLVVTSKLITTLDLL